MRFAPRIMLCSPDQSEKCYTNLYQITYDRAFDQCFDTSKIGRFIDKSSFVAIDVGLRRCLGIFLS